MSRSIPIHPAGRPALAAGLEFRVSPPLALYIHVPWCLRKCPYCDFNSHDLAGPLPETAYLDALIADLESALPLIWGRPVVSLFFGGGTPSLLSPDGLDRFLAALRARVPLQPDAEITLEANPGTAEAERFAGFRAAGVNRLSLGIQSFNDRHLQALGRVHDAAEAHRAITLARPHFERFNLDLMYGLPGQSLAEAEADLAAALDYAPPHLSCYQLTLEPHTRFAHQPPSDLPDDDLCADMQDALEARLAAAGYGHYETSAFALPGRECRHNLNYWHFGDYLGIGAGAHSKLTLHDRVLRQMRWKRPETYLQQVAAGQPLQEQQEIDPAALPFEFLMNALRLLDGVPPALFEARTAQPLTRIAVELARARADGLLTPGPERIAPSDTGRRFLNRLLHYFPH
ncbi:MAG: hypothetical protein RIR00_1293 [Pseudomonadota bacterium]